jgi:hypothetical protein
MLQRLHEVLNQDDEIMITQAIFCSVATGLESSKLGMKMARLILPS